MKKYSHLFFDLDHTLWDFQTNSRQTLFQIFEEFDLASVGIDSSEFLKVYERYNHKMWADYRKGKMSKETLRTERFRQSLAHLGIKDQSLSFEIGEFYVENSPAKTALMPGTIEVLTELKPRYHLHIITNGFEEIQFIKLDRCGLTPFFDKVITSEQAGFQKPNPAIFKYSLALTGATPEESLMIGDNQSVDIVGAQKIGMDGVFFNPEQEKTTSKPTFEISSLKQLLDFL